MQEKSTIATYQFKFVLKYTTINEKHQYHRGPSEHEVI